MHFSKKQLKQMFVAAPLLAMTLLLAGCPAVPTAVQVDTPVAETPAAETPAAETTPQAEAEIPVITIGIGADALTFPEEVPSGIV
jgi:hypothetical protein